MQRRTHKAISLIIAAALIVATIALSTAEKTALNSLVGACLLLASLILWTTEAVPMSITTMFMICILAIINVMSFDEAIANIGVNTSLFIMASSGITVAVGNSRIPQYLTTTIVTHTKGHPQRMVFGIGFFIALCSAFMSSLATCALFNGIILAMLNANDYKPGKSNLGKCLMLAIPACAGIGGFMSPAGTPANILLMDYLQNHNVHISFGQWCIIGFPVGLISVGIFLLFLTNFIKPEALQIKQTGIADSPKALQRNDKLTVVIISTIILLWFLSGWIKTINTTMIAVIGLFVMFIPGINLINWDKFSKGVNWDLVLTMGTVSVLMTGIEKTGVINSLSYTVLHGINGHSAVLSMIIISITICIVRAFIPTTTAVVALLAPVLIEIAHSNNIPIEYLLFILAFWTASALLMVYTEPIYLITYGNGYYKGSDLIRVGIVPCLLLSVLTALVIPAILKMVL